MDIKNSALFLDRDGIINEDFGYVYSFDKFSMIKETLILMKEAKKIGFKIIVLTNQSGIEREYYTHSDVIRLHMEIDHYFFSHGFKIDGWYFSDSSTGDRRKPKPGMIIEAVRDHQIDPRKSLMLGDKLSDVLEFDGPEYNIIQGSYNLDGIDLKRAKIFKTHQDFLDYFRKSTHQWLRD